MRIINREKSNEYYIKGDLQNNKTSINPNLIFNLINIKQDYLSDKDTLFESKNFFSFRLDKNKKIKNIKIDSVSNFDEVYFNNKYQNIIFLKDVTINSKFENDKFTAELVSHFAFSDNSKVNSNFKSNNLRLFVIRENNQNIQIEGKLSNEKVSVDPKIILKIANLDPNLLSDKNVNIVTDNKFKFEINNGKIENYLINSEINLDKVEINTEIQDILYFKNINTNLILGDKLLKVDINSNYSFFDKKLNNISEKNILSLSLDKNNSKTSDVEIFINSV